MFRLYRWLLPLGIVLAVLVLALAGLLRPLGDLGREATLPVLRLTSSLGAWLSGPWRGYQKTENQAQTIQMLEERLQALAVDGAKIQALEEENRVLRAEAKFLDSSGYDSVGARVISRDIHNQRGLLLIDRGSDDHLELGQAAVTENGIFIGKISVLKRQLATIELLSDPHSRVAASLASKSHLSGVIEGRGNGAAVLTYIPSSEVVTRNQIITTAGTDDKIPGHLPVGIVNAVEGKPTDAFFDATIEPLVHADQITFVSILRPSVLKPAL